MGRPPWQPPAQRLPGPHKHYRLFDCLGHGGQGVVFLAESDRQPGKPLAVKFVRDPAWDASPPLAQAFIDEALFGRELRSHNLGHTLELLDLRPWAEEWPPAAMVMEYYPCSLAQVLRECGGPVRLPAGLVARWARELVTGLADLHDRYRRVHRDVKPGNVMFRLPEGRRYEGPASLAGAEALLTDFGTTAASGQDSTLIVFRDRWKDPLLYPDVETFLPGVPAHPEPEEPPGPDPSSTVPHRGPLDALPRQRCVPAMDVHSFGLVLRELAAVTEGDPGWLEEVAADCAHPEPNRRPRAAELFLRLAPDWDEQVRLIREAGRRPEEHPDFEGRTFITQGAFEPFAQSCGPRGGVFVVEGPAGVGKTALLTNWPERAGQPFGFYFRYRDNRTRAAAMPRAVAGQLCRRFGLEFREPASEQDWTGYLERLCADVARRPDAPRRLLIFVDGLDEADEPAQAVGFLPKALPPGVFVVASTRPPALGKDHLALLRSAGGRVYPLRADDPNNLRDVEQYLGKQLHGRLGEAEARQLARNTGGIFLLARLLVEAIQAEQFTVADALRQSQSWAELDPSQRLFAYYRESWERVCAGEDAESLGVFAGLMAAAFTWVSEEQLERVLGWYEREMLRRTARLWTPFRLRAVLRLLTWFLERRGGGPAGTRDCFYQVRHQSVRDYLLSPEGPVPPSGLGEVHAAVGRYYAAEAGRRGWAHVDPYGRFFAVRHLLAAGDPDSVRQAAELLTDLDYLQGTLGDAPPEAAGE
jgi:hypothetical protein